MTTSSKDASPTPSFLLSGLYCIGIAILCQQFMWHDIYEGYSFALDSLRHYMLLLAFIAITLFIYPVFQRKKWAKTGLGITWLVGGAVHLYFTIINHSPWVYFTSYYGESYYCSWQTLAWLVANVVICTLAFLYFCRRKNPYRTLCLLWGSALLFSLLATFTNCMLFFFWIDVSLWTEWLQFIGCLLFFLYLVTCIIKQQGSHTLLYQALSLRKKPVAPTATEECPRQEKKQPIATSWTVRFIFTLLPYCLLGGFLLLFVSTCFYTVAPHQQGLLLRFGTFVDITAPGFHVKLPYPMETVSLYDVSRMQSIMIGYNGDLNNKDYLWNTRHQGDEYTLLTGDGNELLAVNLRINYRIADLLDYYQNYQNPVALLEAQAYTEMMKQTQTRHLSQILIENRSDMANVLTSSLNQFCNEKALGLEVASVIIESIHPAVEVVDVYQNVVNATIGQQTAQHEAETYQVSVMNQALQTKTVEVNLATRQHYEKIAVSTVDVTLFEASHASSLLNPEAYLLRKELSAYTHLLQTGKYYIFSPKTARYMSQFVLHNGTDSIIVPKEDLVP